MAYLSRDKLESLGFRSLGTNVLISEKASIYSPSEMAIGSNVRIDDFCILSGQITIGSNIHISAFSALYGKDARIELRDFSGISPRSTIFSGTDDFSGAHLLGALVPEHLRQVTAGPVVLGRFSQLGANSVVLPDCHLGEGAVTGIFTFVNRCLDDWTIYAGIPAKALKARKKDLLGLLDQWQPPA